MFHLVGVKRCNGNLPFYFFLKFTDFSVKFRASPVSPCEQSVDNFTKSCQELPLQYLYMSAALQIPSFSLCTHA